MKIGVIGSYPPPYGGVSISIKQCSEIWAEGHEVHVIDLASSGGTRMVGKAFIHEVTLNKTIKRRMLSAISSLTYRRIKRISSLRKITHFASV